MIAVLAATLALKPSLTIIPGCTGVRGLSGDGSTLLVETWPDGAPAVWSQGRLQRIAPLRGYAVADAGALSDDGKVAGGYCANGPRAAADSVAFTWTAPGGTRRLEPLASGWSSLREVTAISRDGSIVVGEGSPGAGRLEAFRWTRAGGAQHLGFVDSRFSYSGATCVSADGSTIGGWSAVGRLMPTQMGGSWMMRKAVAWDSAGHMRVLSTADSGRDEVRDISSDGRLALVADKTRDFLWPTLEPLVDRRNTQEFTGWRILSPAPVVNGVADPGLGSLWSPKSGLVTSLQVMNYLRGLHLGSLGQDPSIDGYSRDLSVVVGRSMGPVWVITLPKGTLQRKFGIG